MSPSTRRAWIEMQLANQVFKCDEKSPSTRRAWIEIPIRETVAVRVRQLSPSTRRAWIEICSAQSSMAQISAGRPPPGGRG